MRHLLHFFLLLSLYSSQTLASEIQQVELIVFRQGNDKLPSSRLAPDDWADAASLITPSLQRSTQLDYLANKLNPDNGYQVLLHQAWLQSSADIAVAIKAGPAHFAHHPIEGTLSFKLGKNRHKVAFDLWFNQFNPDTSLQSSERMQQLGTLANAQVSFIDHYPFGALLRIQAHNKPAPNTQANHAEDFE